MKKIIAIAAIVILAGGTFYFLLARPTTSVHERITAAVAQRLDLPAEKVSLEFSREDAHHWAGTYTVLPWEPGNSAGFIATDASGTMRVVWMGQDAPLCSIFTENDFPAGWEAGCYQE